MPGLVQVGAAYCTVHHGLLNEDDNACDFARDDIDDGNTVYEVGDDGEEYDTGEPRPCDPQQLFYVAPPESVGAHS
jgi:hypothetical protein